MKPKNSMKSTDLWKHRKMYKKARVFRARLVAVHKSDAHYNNDYLIGVVGKVILTHYHLGTEWKGGDMLCDDNETLLFNFAQFEKLKEESTA